MTQKTIFRIAAVVATLALGATGAFAGSKPPSPTPIVPPNPPAPPSVIIAQVTPQQARAAQALARVLLNNPPPSMTASFQGRVVNVLNQSLGKPGMLAQLGLTPPQIREMIAQVQAIPTTPG